MKPTSKVAAGSSASGIAAILAGLSHDLGVDISWLTSKPTLYGLVLTAIGFAVAWLKREVR